METRSQAKQEILIMRSDERDKFNGDLNTLCDHQSSEAALPTHEACPLVQPQTSRVREYVPPRNEVETGVAQILAEFLEMEQVGIHDNFILLGGESLRASQAAWRIRERFGCEVTLRSILAGTVADIAAEILTASNV